MIFATLPLPGEQEMDWLLNVNAGQNRSLATQYQHRGLSNSVGGTEPPFSAGPQLEIGKQGFNRDLSNYTEQHTEGDNFAGEYDRVGPENLDLLGASLTGSWQLTDAIEKRALPKHGIKSVAD